MLSRSLLNATGNVKRTTMFVTSDRTTKCGAQVKTRKPNESNMVS